MSAKFVPTPQLPFTTVHRITVAVLPSPAVTPVTVVVSLVVFVIVPGPLSIVHVALSLVVPSVSAASPDLWPSLLHQTGHLIHGAAWLMSGPRAGRASLLYDPGLLHHRAAELVLV